MRRRIHGLPARSKAVAMSPVGPCLAKELRNCFHALDGRGHADPQALGALLKNSPITPKTASPV